MKSNNFLSGQDMLILWTLSHTEINQVPLSTFSKLQHLHHCLQQLNKRDA